MLNTALVILFSKIDRSKIQTHLSPPLLLTEQALRHGAQRVKVVELEEISRDESETNLNRI